MTNLLLIEDDRKLASRLRARATIAAVLASPRHTIFGRSSVAESSKYVEYSCGPARSSRPNLTHLGARSSEVILARALSDYLAESGFRVAVAKDGAAGLDRLLSGPFDIALLDVMLPGMDGFEVLREARKHTSLPIIMLTARGEETDRVVGLELGADDYVQKPFSPRELLARIRALLRRSGAPPDKAKLQTGNLLIDPDARAATLGATLLPLTALQFDLLYHLASRPGRVFSRNDLSEQIRGQELGYADRSIDVHISRIRALVEEDPKHPRRIKTIRGAGYLFVKDPA